MVELMAEEEGNGGEVGGLNSSLTKTIKLTTYI